MWTEGVLLVLTHCHVSWCTQDGNFRSSLKRQNIDGNGSMMINTNIYIYTPIFCLVDQTLWENSPSGLTNAMTSLAHRDPTRRGTEKQVEIIKVTRMFSDGRWPWVRSCLFNMSLWWLKANLLWKMLHSWIFYLYFTTFFHILPIKHSDFPVRYVK